MTSPDPKYLKNKKQKKAYLEDLKKRFQMVLWEVEKKYPDVTVSPNDSLEVLTELLAEKSSRDEGYIV